MYCHTLVSPGTGATLHTCAAALREWHSATRIRPSKCTTLQNHNKETASGLPERTFSFFSVLMMELLPTFGYPMNPTLICFLSCANAWPMHKRLAPRNYFTHTAFVHKSRHHNIYGLNLGFRMYSRRNLLISIHVLWVKN
jgi:hypothetical protein